MKQNKKRNIIKISLCKQKKEIDFNKEIITAESTQSDQKEDKGIQVNILDLLECDVDKKIDSNKFGQ